MSARISPPINEIEEYGITPGGQPALVVSAPQLQDTMEEMLCLLKCLVAHVEVITDEEIEECDL